MTAAIKDAVQIADAATVMSLLPAKPRLLALGEPTHGEDDLLNVRNDRRSVFSRATLDTTPRSSPPPP